MLLWYPDGSFVNRNIRKFSCPAQKHCGMIDEQDAKVNSASSCNRCKMMRVGIRSNQKN